MFSWKQQLWWCCWHAGRWLFNPALHAFSIFPKCVRSEASTSFYAFLQWWTLSISVSSLKWLLADCGWVSESHHRDVTVSFSVHLLEEKQSDFMSPHPRHAIWRCHWLYFSVHVPISVHNTVIYCIRRGDFCVFCPGGISKLRGWAGVGGMFSGKALSTKCQPWNIERVIML